MRSDHLNKHAKRHPEFEPGVLKRWRHGSGNSTASLGSTGTRSGSPQYMYDCASDRVSENNSPTFSP